MHHVIKYHPENDELPVTYLNALNKHQRWLCWAEGKIAVGWYEYQAEMLQQFFICRIFLIEI